MTKKQSESLSPGLRARRVALQHLSYLVTEDEEFKAARRSILERFRPLEGLDFDGLVQLLLSARRESGRRTLPEQLMHEVTKLAVRYDYDKIKDGVFLMFQMVITGLPPSLWALEDYMTLAWKPTFLIAPHETFDEMRRRVEKDLRRFWGESDTARNEWQWTDHLSLSDLPDKVEWYFERKIKGIPLRRVAANAVYSEGTIRRGIRQVQHLLGIPPDRPGRPPKLVNAHDRN